MQKVITVNLNGAAYQLEESAYGALVAYLDRASATLADNPDRAEIMADLEQAIADKCQRHLGAHKNVIASAEIDEVLKEMGPVDPPAGEAADAGDASSNSRDDAHAGAAPKRLYQIREGAMFSGVCTGLAAYFNIDVTIVRIVFVILAIATQGIWVLVYLILMFVIPHADTSEERAAAHGLPFNARELIDRARQNLREGQTWGRRHWQQSRARHEARRARARERRRWRQAERDRQYQWWTPPPRPPMGYAAHVGLGLLMPLFVLVSVVGLLALAFVVVSLVNTHAVLGWTLPPDIPVWAALLGAFVLYLMVMAPFHAARHAARQTYGWYAAWDGLLWLAVIGVMIWIASTHGPEIRDVLRRFFQNLPDVWHGLQRSTDSLLNAGTRVGLRLRAL
jgi:phage shock protein PspC (stress-responsive transcriptional regulator)